MIRIEIPGDPTPKQSARIKTIRNKFTGKNINMSYQPKRVVDYAKLVKMCALQVRPKDVFIGAVSVEILVYFKRPKAHYKKNGEPSSKYEYYCKKKPDLDNIAKNCLDPLNGVIWKDDSLVVDLKLFKRWSDKGRVVIHVQELEE